MKNCPLCGTEIPAPALPPQVEGEPPSAIVKTSGLCQTCGVHFDGEQVNCTRAALRWIRDNQRLALGRVQTSTLMLGWLEKMHGLTRAAPANIPTPERS